MPPHPPSPGTDLVEGNQGSAEQRRLYRYSTTGGEADRRVRDGIPGFTFNMLDGRAADGFRQKWRRRAGAALRRRGEDKVGGAAGEDEREGGGEDGQVAGDFAGAGAGQEGDEGDIGGDAVPGKPLVAGQGRANEAGEGVSDVGGAHAALAEIGFFKREDAQEVVEGTELADAVLAPRPNLGGDEIDDRYALSAEFAGEAEVEVWGVGEDGEVGALGGGGTVELTKLAVDAGDVAEHLDEPDDIEVGGIDDGADACGAHAWTGAAEEIRGGQVLAEGLDEGGGVEIAGSLAGGDENFHERSVGVRIASRLGVGYTPSRRWRR